jgi:hypothetical protein
MYLLASIHGVSSDFLHTSERAGDLLSDWTGDSLDGRARLGESLLGTFDRFLNLGVKLLVLLGRVKSSTNLADILSHRSEEGLHGVKSEGGNGV